MTHDPIHVVGGGLAGAEAAWTLAQAGQSVVVHEMRPQRATPAHKTALLGELVCSNSFRSDDWRTNAVGLLHAELRALGSLVMACAAAHQVPAGSALAVDREGFAQAMNAALENHPRIEIRREEVTDPVALGPQVIVATGPLTSPALSGRIAALTGADALAFFDAIAPIVHRDSIDFQIAWMQSRYDKEGPGGDEAAYVNCPLDQQQYERFIAAILVGEKAEFHAWERDTPYFEGCLPIEVMAERGPQTLRFGPMKPVGLIDPRTNRRPYAVVQLRQDNALGTLFNMVGFQTKLKHGAQTEIFRTIPALERAVFARLGGVHRNTFINAPALLDETLRLKACPSLRFAGQVTGVEGYVESAAIGLLAGRFVEAERRGARPFPPPQTTAMGALLAHVTGGHIADGARSFQPMNCNFGLFPPIESAPCAAPSARAQGPGASGRKGKGAEKGRARKTALSERALADLHTWMEHTRA